MDGRFAFIASQETGESTCKFDNTFSFAALIKVLAAFRTTPRLSSRYCLP